VANAADAMARARSPEGGGGGGGEIDGGVAGVIQRREAIEYDGYEDGRAIEYGGSLYLLANHEDCEGRRRLCLVRLEGDPASGGLRQGGTWVLRVDDDANGTTFQLQDNEKNWVPFVDRGVLHLSYSLEPHVVLRCAWSGGSCRQVFTSGSDFLSTYDTLRQGLRGGTPYARLPDGTLLAAMHIKDMGHTPALYGTAFYIISSAPPYRVRSISPKVCLSDAKIELAISARCALQYVSGLAIDPERNVALVSYGEHDRRMKLAALDLEGLVSLARTHDLGEEDEEGEEDVYGHREGVLSVSECAKGGSWAPAEDE
jgi:hypothetical protein